MWLCPVGRLERRNSFRRLPWEISFYATVQAARSFCYFNFPLKTGADELKTQLMKLQIHTSESADEVEKYLRAKHSIEAYYSTDEQEIVGDWGGKGAALLGLSGVVTNEAFARVIHNLHPETGEQLTDRMRKDRRPGFDMVFNVPKSVSLLYAFTKDERLMRAFRETVREVVEIAEDHAAVRVRAGDKNSNADRVTKILVTAEHIHLTARPEDGYSDPHMHIHLYVPNISFDCVEKKWKALQLGLIREQADEFEKMATKIMADKLRALGLKLRQTEHAYEIEGFERDFIEQFSRRTLTIEKTAERLGITDPAAKAKLAATTRQNKIKDVKFSDFEEIWRASLTEEQKQVIARAAECLERTRTKGQALPDSVGFKPRPEALKNELGRVEQQGVEALAKRVRGNGCSMNARTRPGATERKPVQVTDDEREAVRLAAEHLFERNCVVTELQIAGEASRNWKLQRTTMVGLIQAAKELPLLRQEKNSLVYATTPEIWAEEERIKTACFEGRGTFPPMMNNWEIQDLALNTGQRAAVLHVLMSRDFITGLKGDPGVGKTRVLQEILLGAKQGFNEVLMLAPGSSTVHNVLRADGFVNAETVAMLLRNPNLQRLYAGAVWVVDEAAQLSNPDLEALMILAREKGSRLVLVGDSAQHIPVGRGCPFEMLQKSGLMSTYHLEGIQRQIGIYKRTVELVLAKETTEALDLMAAEGYAVELPLKERLAVLAKEYADTLEAGESTVVACPTHRERRLVTEAIRAERKARGHLRDAYRKQLTAKLPYSDIQKSMPEYYRVGMIVEMEAEVKGFKLNERVEVVGVRPDMVKVRSLHRDNHRTRPLPLHQPDVFSVYETQTQVGHHHEVLSSLSWSDTQKQDLEHYKPGLWVQVNGHVPDFALGEQLQVTEVRSDGVVARNARNQEKLLPLESPAAFSVYERERIEVCEGERIRITGNGRCVEGRALRNGTDYTVDYITHEGEIVLTNGRRLGGTFRHFEYGDTDTSHGVQGRTLDRIFISARVELSRDAIDMRQFLVSLSRGREEPRMFTDDLEMLADCVARVRDPMSVGDMFELEPERAHGMSRHLGSWKMNPQPKREALSAQLGNHAARNFERSVAAPLSGRLGTQPTGVDTATQECEAPEQVEESELKKRREMALGLSI